MTRMVTASAVVVSFAAVVVVGAFVRNPKPTARAPKEWAAAAYGRLPLAFEARRGQSGEAVKFVSRASGYTMLLTPTETVLSMTDRRASVRFKLLGANPAAQAEGLDELPGRSNYFIGNDPKKWRTSIPHYAKVRYRSVYPGVDLVYYGNQQHTEHDFIVAPGVDPSQIRFEVTGADGFRLDREGALVIAGVHGEMRLRKPNVYQEEDGARTEVAGAYRLMPGNQVGFTLGPYDKTKPLVIDPVLEYSTYFGGSDVDNIVGLERDETGVYLFGQTGSVDFPITPGAFQPSIGGIDAFVAKLSLDGTRLIYSTYLGGSGTEDPFMTGQIGIDGGHAFVIGRTDSRDFPMVNPFQPAFGGGPWDAFYAKLSPDGSRLLYSSYFGGDNDDQAEMVAMDAAGSAYISGLTSSPDFPTRTPFQRAYGGGPRDVFVTKVDADGKLVYSTFLGGNGDESFTTIAVDSRGQAYVSGRTNSTDFPTAAPFQSANAGGQFDVFVTKFSESGTSLIFSTYIGGSGNDQHRMVLAGPDEHVYVSGLTTSTNFPTLHPIQASHAGGQDAFLLKMLPDGSGLVFSTYFGGSGDERFAWFTVDRFGQPFLTGLTNSPNFPTLNPIQAAFGGGAWDALLVQISASGRDLLFSTYLGGSGDDRGFDIGLDGAGDAYVIGPTTSTDFPTRNPIQRSHGGATDGWLAKIAPGVIAVSSASSVAPLAPDSLASLMGSGLALATASAAPASLPTSLGGISLRLRDSAGVERLAPLLHVSPTQINFHVPAGAAPGYATLSVVNAPGTLPPVVVPIRNLAPGLFTLRDNMAAAYGVRIEANGNQTVLPAGSPITLDDRPVYLCLFGTGIRGRSSVENVRCTIGGISVPVEYAGPGGGVPGLDQVNVRLLPALRGNRDQRLILTVDDQPANVVSVDIR